MSKAKLPQIDEKDDCSLIEIAYASDFEAVVNHYISCRRKSALRELKFYATQKSLESVIREAALARMPSGKRHPHQRRIPRSVLEEACNNLLSVDLQNCTSTQTL